MVVRKLVNGFSRPTLVILQICTSPIPPKSTSPRNTRYQPNPTHVVKTVKVVSANHNKDVTTYKLQPTPFHSDQSLHNPSPVRSHIPHAAYRNLKFSRQMNPGRGNHSATTNVRPTVALAEFGLIISRSAYPHWLELRREAACRRTDKQRAPTVVATTLKSETFSGVATQST
jgi:hypothetical protein